MVLTIYLIFFMILTARILALIKINAQSPNPILKWKTARYDLKIQGTIIKCKAKWWIYIYFKKTLMLRIADFGDN